MPRNYCDYQFKIGKDYYENPSNGNYFILTKTENSQTYNVVFFNKNGMRFLEKNFIAKNNCFEEQLEEIVKEYGE